jgi:hypothetical protein
MPVSSKKEESQETFVVAPTTPLNNQLTTNLLYGSCTTRKHSLPHYERKLHRLFWMRFSGGLLALIQYNGVRK